MIVSFTCIRLETKKTIQQQRRVCHGLALIRPNLIWLSYVQDQYYRQRLKKCIKHQIFDPREQSNLKYFCAKLFCSAHIVPIENIFTAQVGF